ncbi:hypothetical protein EDB92DRAFT_2014805 [Lactarius akahatsu]|uniref:C2H2-type domain-containing protein n=1 Tax=Lactarius akahatsu TaxID=416441 RepID=A0AAD4Q8W3_9AGAM|nr:hypothetical protein EDB92DRAFT_2014805 [Lactarius akahatsu]
MTRAVPPASCRIRVELSWKTPRQRPEAPFSSEQAFLLPQLSPSPLYLMDRPSDSSRRPSVSLPGIRTLFPDHLLATDGRNCPPQSNTHARSYPEQSVRQLPSSDHTNSTILTRTHPSPYERRVPIPPPSDGYRHVIPPSPLGCTSSAEPSYASSRAPFQPIRHPTSPSQPSQEIPRLHPVGSAPLLPRPASPSSTISENESPRSETSSQGDLSADDSLPPLPADKQSDSGRRHACPHCAKRFNRPSSLAIHVNTHTGDKRKLISGGFHLTRSLTFPSRLQAFKCPFPNCGREFNVNSNMRRHYRKHLTATTPQAPRPGSFYSPQGSPGLGIQIIRYHDHQSETRSSDVGGVAPIDSPDTRNPRSANARWRAL